jgi:hypothetical protein
VDREFFQRNGLLRAKGEISFDRNHTNTLARCFDEEATLKMAKAQAQAHATGVEDKTIEKVTKQYLTTTVSWMAALKKKIASFVASEEDEY